LENLVNKFNKRRSKKGLQQKEEKKEEVKEEVEPERKKSDINSNDLESL